MERERCARFVLCTFRENQRVSSKEEAFLEQRRLHEGNGSRPDVSIQF